MNPVKNIFSALLLFLLLPVMDVSGQIEAGKRLEFELREGYENFDLAQFRENGILVFYHAEKSVKDNLTWKVDHYSTDLEIVDSKEIIISEDYRLQKTVQDDLYLYLFFLHHSDEYLFVRVNSKTLEVERMEGLLPEKTFSKEITVIDNKVIVYCTSKKSKMLRVLDFKSGAENDVAFSIEEYEPNDVSLLNIQVDDDSQELYFFFNAKFEKSYQLYVMRFNDEAELQEKINLSEDSPWVFSTISGTFLAEGEYMFTGTYSEKSTDKSEGIFICKTTNGKKDFHKFYNFLEFEEFLSYLPEKEQDKIEKRKNKKEDQGEELKLNYLMLSHNVRFIDGKYIYIGEAYYPTYNTYSSTNSSGLTTTTVVFAGYFYTHATVAGFDEEGEKLWDKTFEIKPKVKPFTLSEIVQVTQNSPTELGLMFASGDSVESKAINTYGEVVRDRSVKMIAKSDGDDQTKWTYSALTYLYDNFFLAHGSQLIKNIEEKGERGKRRRQVYFINKISYSF